MLTTTGTSSNIIVDAALTGTAVELNASGTLNQNSAGIITTTYFSGSSVGNATLSANNVIAELAGFTTSNGALTLNDTEALIVTGAVNTGSGNLSLTTSAGNSMTLYASLTGATVDLVSGGALGQNGNGIITATTLTGSSVDRVTLTAQNVITDLGDFTVYNDANFYLTNSIHLTQTGTVNAGTGTVDIVSP